jgi:hypothetical protein
MIVYKVFYKNYELKKGELMGMLIERRKDLRGLKQVESGLRWAYSTFGHMVKDKKAMFVVPSEFNSKIDSRWLMEKGVFIREELLGMVKLVDQEIKSETMKKIEG